MPVDHSLMKLGKRPPRIMAGQLMLAKYTVALPPSPPSVAYSSKITNPGMMLNNILGCCTCSAVGHTIQGWTANASIQTTISDAAVLALYEESCGYVQGNPDTDQGGVESDVLTFWKNNPAIVGGHELAGAVAVGPGNHADVQDAIWLFGSSYIGLSLPLSAQTQDVWDVPQGGATGQGAPGSWGGHAVAVLDYDSRGLNCITWGGFKRMTWPFWDAYCDEAHALVSKDWINSGGKSPSGFDLNTLITDLLSV